ncbi:hypothetical protein HDF16_005400 [Granulicella aggregans]|uniref:Uncharacterized protein n=1 Tax=Granulicella aggregans TaxID=474949 RepID=A0A7W8E6T0_9BACT|nr:hypothetical protein [Granulicella aggregans]MBB5060664.1 hypothetical protein [Granulicella aggregans]
MTDKRSNPPSFALWLLRHTASDDWNEALTGDLIETFRDRQSRWWFWGQVLFASTLGALETIRRRWYFFCYAITGAVTPYIFEYSNVLVRVWPFSSHWSDLPWPLSQFVLEMGLPAIAASMSLLVLSVGLLIEGSFRWAYLLRTFIITLILISAVHFSIDLFPWLLRPIPGDQHRKSLIVPGIFVVLLLGSTYLLAAWLGCPSIEHPHKRERQIAEPQ